MQFNSLTANSSLIFLPMRSILLEGVQRWLGLQRHKNSSAFNLILQSLEFDQLRWCLGEFKLIIQLDNDKFYYLHLCEETYREEQSNVYNGQHLNFAYFILKWSLIQRITFNLNPIPVGWVSNLYLSAVFPLFAAWFSLWIRDQIHIRGYVAITSNIIE